MELNSSVVDALKRQMEAHGLADAIQQPEQDRRGVQLASEWLPGKPLDVVLCILNNGEENFCNGVGNPLKNPPRRVSQAFFRVVKAHHDEAMNQIKAAGG